MLFDVVVNFGDLDEPSLLKLSVNLWNLVLKQSGSVSNKSLVKKNVIWVAGIDFRCEDRKRSLRVKRVKLARGNIEDIR
jgi:hypothetical protein